MVTFTIKTDFKQVQRQLDTLSIDMQKRVIPAAINKVVAKANTAMVKEITSEFNIKSDEVRSNLRIIRAKKELARWYAVLDPFAKNKKGRGLNLIRFLEKSVTLAEGRRRKKAGTQNQLQFQIKRGAGKKPIAGAFVGNKGRTVFIREGADRLPIKAMTTIDVAQMFNTKRINLKVIEKINAELAIEFERAIKAVQGGFIR